MKLSSDPLVVDRSRVMHPWGSSRSGVGEDGGDEDGSEGDGSAKEMPRPSMMGGRRRCCPLECACSPELIVGRGSG